MLTQANKKAWHRICQLALSITCVLGLTVSLNACSSQKTAQQTATENEPVELSLLAPGYESGHLKQQIDEGITAFEAAYPNINVKVIPVGWDELNAKIVQLYQAHEAPDIMMLGTRSLRQFSELGALEDLSPYMTDSFKNARVSSVLNTAAFGDKQYGIPFAFSSRALIYRTDLIEKAPTTWDEVFETAQAIHEAHPDMYGFSVPTDITGGADELLSFIYQNGGSVIDEQGNYTLNTPENVQTFEYLRKFAEAGLIPDPVSMRRGKQIELFKNGQLAMYVIGAWDRKELEANKDKAPFASAPIPAGKQQALTLVTDSYTISSLSKHKDAAWKFIDFMGQENHQRSVSEAYNWFPILKAEQGDKRFQEEFNKPFAQVIDKGIPEPHTPNWDAFNKALINAAQKALSGQMSAQEALDEAQQELMK